MLLRNVRHAVQIRRRSTLLDCVVVLGVVAVGCLVERSAVRDRRQVEGGWRNRDGVGRAGCGRVGALERLALGCSLQGGLFSSARSLWPMASRPLLAERFTHRSRHWRAPPPPGVAARQCASPRAPFQGYVCAAARLAGVSTPFPECWSCQVG